MKVIVHGAPGEVRVTAVADQDAIADVAKEIAAGEPCAIVDRASLPATPRDSWRIVSGRVVSDDGIARAGLVQACTARMDETCGALILERYPVHKQLNVIRAGGSDLAAMTAWIDGVRAKAKSAKAALGAMTVDELARWSPPSLDL